MTPRRITVEQHIVDVLNEYDVGMACDYSPFAFEQGRRTKTASLGFIGVTGTPVVFVDGHSVAVPINHLRFIMGD